MRPEGLETLSVSDIPLPLHHHETPTPVQVYPDSLYFPTSLEHHLPQQIEACLKSTIC